MRSAAPLLLGAAAVGGGLYLLSRSSDAQAAPATPAPAPAATPSGALGPPQNVLVRMAAAIASGDPTTLRAEAAILRREGYAAQAAQLEGVAAQIDAAQAPAPAPTPVAWPAPPPVVAQPTPVGAPPAPIPTIQIPLPSGGQTSIPMPQVPAEVLQPASSKPTLRKGVGLKPQAPNAQVSDLQMRLNLAGARDGSGNMLVVDGRFGARTDESVRAYQRRYGLEVDGVVGPQTWGHLLGERVSGDDTGGCSPRLIAAAERFMRAAAEHGITAGDVRELERAVGREQSGHYTPALARILARCGHVPPPPKAYRDRSARKRWVGECIRMAARDPQRADEWVAASGVRSES